MPTGACRGGASARTAPRSHTPAGTLVLTRHGQSEWNKLNLFTGWKDPALTDLGKQEALKGAQELKKYGYVSGSALACRQLAC